MKNGIYAVIAAGANWSNRARLIAGLRVGATIAKGNIYIANTGNGMQKLASGGMSTAASAK